MDCRQAEQLAHLRLDREIEGPDCVDLDRHLATCPHCRDRFEDEASLHAQMRETLKDKSCVDTAPQHLKARIRKNIARRQASPKRARTRTALVAAAAAALGALALGYAKDDDPIIEETVARHGRNLPPEVRARAADEREIDQFLRNNLNFPVRIPRLTHATPPVRLVGARLSNLQDRDAAYVMYDHRGAKLSLFAYPASRRFSTPEGFEERNVRGRRVLVGKKRGYNVVSWQDRQFEYSLVSDVDPSELVQLVSHAR